MLATAWGVRAAPGHTLSAWNATHHSTGHVWQGRYYACPLDEPHLWEALRYTELNPVRAGLVDKAACCGLWRICGAAFGNAGTGLGKVLEPARLFSVASSPILEQCIFHL